MMLFWTIVGGIALSALSLWIAFMVIRRLAYSEIYATERMNQEAAESERIIAEFAVAEQDRIDSEERAAWELPADRLDRLCADRCEAGLKLRRSPDNPQSAANFKAAYQRETQCRRELLYADCTTDRSGCGCDACVERRQLPTF